MRSRSLAAVALLAATATACTGLGGLTRAAPTRSADPAARPGGTLTVAIDAPASVDPATVQDEAGALVSSLVCEPLVQLDPVTGAIVPGIAEVVEAGGRGSVLTIRLRDGVRFHDGSAVTAQDVAYTLSRVARHDLAAPDARVLSMVDGFGVLNGPPDPEDPTPLHERELTGVRPISRTALEILLGESRGEFARALSLPFAAPVPRRLPDRDAGFAAQPTCAGPYRMAAPYREGDREIVLRRFDGYYGANSGWTRGGRGYADTIIFRIYRDRAAQMRAYRRGEVDLAHVPPARLDAAERRRNEFLQAPAPAIELVGIPAGLEGFDDPATRRALSAAIDREALVERVFDGGRLPADRFFPPALAPADRPEACAAAVPSPSGATDRKAARALRGRALDLKVNDDFRNRRLAEELARQWRTELGLDVRVIALPWNDYLTQATSAEGLRAAFRTSWEPAYAGFDAVVAPLFHSSSVGRDNWARFEDAEFDRRLERSVRRAVDPALQRRQYASLEAMLCERLPLIPLTFGAEEYLARTTRIAPAGDAWFDRSTGRPLLRELFVQDITRGDR